MTLKHPQHRLITVLPASRLAVLASVLLLSACGNSAPLAGAHSAVTGSCPFAAPPPALHSSCGKSSWTAGAVELCSGKLLYRDYLYDDNGADKPVPTTRFNPNSSNVSVVPSGDDAYPQGAENTADIVRFEMQLVGNEVQVTFELNTLYDTVQTVGVVALDADNNAATGGGTWPGFNTASAGWDEIHRISQADPVTNLITGRFPKPAGSAWKVWAALAQADGTVMNVAFRGVETTEGSWFDQKQATALAAGDITAFAATVCPAEMRAGLTRGASVQPGVHERIYTSQYTLPPGEGISIEGIAGPKVNKDPNDPRVFQSFNFLGRYQPYAYYLPDLPGPHGVQLLLHGFSSTHAANVPAASVQAAFGDGLNRLVIAPLARGLAGAYSYSSERDTLDVLDDALANFDVDRSKVIVSGISMGGYGQLAFGTLYPDRFAGMIGWVSPTGNFETYPAGQTPTYIPGSLVANTAKLVRNLRNLPVLLRYGDLDEFILKLESDKMLDYMLGTVAGEQGDAGVFNFDKVLNADHVTTFGNDQLLEAAISADWQQPAHVARVSYRMDPALAAPEYGIKHDRAYWVSAISARDAAHYADVDLSSAGCGLPVPVTADGTTQGTGPSPLIWQRTFRHVVSSTPTVAANRLEGVIANVSALAIDTAGACLTAGSLRYQIQTDGPLLLRLSDGRQIMLSAAGIHDGTI